MPERVDLTAPVSTTGYEVVTLHLDFKNAFYSVRLESNTGERREVTKTNAGAELRALNKANLSTKSLQRRIMERLIADGDLPGNITGIPD